MIQGPVLTAVSVIHWGSWDRSHTDKGETTAVPTSQGHGRTSWSSRCRGLRTEHGTWSVPAARSPELLCANCAALFPDLGFLLRKTGRIVIFFS